MAGQTIRAAYRATFYKPRSQNDATESQVMVPAAGAAHAEAFQVATVQGLTGFRPYLFPPRGRGGKIDPLDKKTDIGLLAFDIGDVRVPDGALQLDNARRWLSAFLGDVHGQQQWAGAKVFLEECLDWDTVAHTGTWAPYYTGRVVKAPMKGRLTFTFNVRDLAGDLTGAAFVGVPHAAVTYAHRTSLWPFGLDAPFGNNGATPSPIGTVGNNFATPRAGEVTPAKRSLTFDTTSGVETTARTVVKALADAGLPSSYGGAVTKGDQGVHQDLFVIDFTPDDSSAVPVYVDTVDVATNAVARFRAAQAGANQVGGVWTLDHLYFVPIPGGAALPAAGARLSARLASPTLPVSAGAPILINDVHPAQLLADIARGYFGPLKDDGSPVCGVTVRAAELAALLADATFPLGRFVIEAEAKSGAQWAEENICKPYNITYAFDGAGQLVITDLRQAHATSAVFALTDADLTEDAPGWQPQGDTAVSRLVFSYFIDTRVADEDLAQLAANGAGLPDVPSSRIVPDEVTRKYENISPRALDLTPQTYTVKATGLRAFADEPGRVATIQRQIDALRSDLAGPYGLGITIVTLSCRRTANSALALPGSYGTVAAAALPNPAINARGGTRVLLVTQRVENGATIAITAYDVGSDDAAPAPTLAAPTLSTYDSRTAVDAAVTLAGGEPAELWAATTATSVGTRPADGDAAWRFVGQLTSSRTVPVSGNPINRRVWLRVRTLPTTGAARRRPSAWAYPASGTGYVDLATVPAPTALAVSNLTRASADVAWTDGDAGLPLEVLLADGSGVPAGGWSEADVVQRFGIKSLRTTLYSLLGPSHTYRVAVRHVGPYGGYTDTIDAVFTTGATLDAAPVPLGIAILNGEAA